MIFPLQGAYIEGFSKYVALMNPWDRSVREKAICAFVPTPELAKEAIDAGAHTAGGLELIQDIIKGRFEVVSSTLFKSTSPMWLLVNCSWF